MRDSGSEGVAPEDVIAHADGEAAAATRDRIASTPALRDEAAAYDRMQRRLQRQLRRFDCPAPHALGEYALALVPVEERTRIASHVTQCPRCADELATLRAFLGTEPLPVPTGTATGRVRRLIAALIPAAPAVPVAQLRGAGDDGARTYRAGDVMLTLDAGAARGGRADLTGLLWRDGTDDDANADAAVPEGAVASLFVGDGEPRTATVDELGNFAFEGVPFGEYRLEVPCGGDAIVVVEGVRIGP